MAKLKDIKKEREDRRHKTVDQLRDEQVAELLLPAAPR